MEHNDKYILEKLLKWVPFFYGKDKAKYAKAFMRNGNYVFGYVTKDASVLNSLNRKVAIYLALEFVEAVKSISKFLTELEPEQPVKRQRGK